MNFKQTLILIETKEFKYENLWVFLYVYNSNLLLPKNEYKKNCIMKTKRPFMKVVSLNEVVKHPSPQPNLDIGRNFNTFKIFQYPY
jgi:hypothetical protein